MGQEDWKAHFYCAETVVNHNILGRTEAYGDYEIPKELYVDPYTQLWGTEDKKVKMIILKIYLISWKLMFLDMNGMLQIKIKSLVQSIMGETAKSRDRVMVTRQFH